MSRRLLTAGLLLAVLLGAQSGFGRISAKPPDLPLVDNDVLNVPLLIVEESDAPTAAPAPEISALFQLRPSVRRTMASCVLFGVHPLLALAPTEGVVDLDEEDYAPAPADFPFPLYSTAAPEGRIFTGSFTIWHPPAPAEDATPKSPESVCPYVRQQQCAPDRHAVLFADSDFSRDVLQNLEALRQSQELLEKARQLGRDGRVIEALDYLSQAAELCPGSRFDEEIKATAAEVLSNASATEREIEQKLLQPVTLYFADAPLFQVLDDLHGREGFNIYVDKAALDAEEISLDRSVSIKVENVPLKSALKLILKQARLIYLVKDDVVQITTEQKRGVGIQPSLPPVDAGVPTALNHLLYETLKVGLSAVGESEEQEAPVDSPAHSSLEFGFGLDGGFRLFTQFQQGGAVWHLEYNQDGLKWWASPDGGADENSPRCTGFNLEQAPAPSQQ